MYYLGLSNLVNSSIEVYVNLFLLWLLYRFMKPHRFLDGGKTETSTLLFAHDVERAQKSLLEGFIEESEDR